MIYFNYDTIVDFSIGVKSIDKDDLNDLIDDIKDEETLNAEIESKNIFYLYYLNIWVIYSIFFKFRLQMITISKSFARIPNSQYLFK